jgi:TonB-linked SusC/RagA family outer membrane protein
MYKILELSIRQLRFLSFLFLLLITSISAYSQQTITVSGTVRDSSDTNTLIGVSVSVVGSTQGIQTDINGKFTLNVPSNGTLLFRYIGYEPKRVSVNGDTKINVFLSSNTKGLDEVTVVAFGTQKKLSVTGSISSIQTREIKQSPAANLAVTLAGRLPGLTSIQKSGEPGRDLTQLYIRGQGTINGQSPIVLVDGVERDLTYIDPNEVENITILKDASSTALFGVRGANGVILITTKRGTSEIPTINFSAETGIQDFTRILQPVNSYDFATLRNLAQANDGIGPAFSQDALNHYKNGDDPTRYPNTNWRDLLMKKYSAQQRYNLNVSGASKSMKYFVNASYLNQGGQFKTEANLPYDPSFSLSRYNFRSNIDVRLNKSLTAFLNVAGYLEKQNMSAGVTNLFGNSSATLNSQSASYFILNFMNDMNATDPGPLTPDGQVVTNSIVPQPAYGQINRSGYTQQTRSNVLATYGMEQQLDMITKGLSAKAVISFDSKSTNNLFGARNYQKYVQVIDPNNLDADGKPLVTFRRYNADENTPLSLSGASFFTSLSNVQAYINYNRTFNSKHAVSGLLLYNQQKNIINAELPYNLRGVASRLTYAYDSKYLFELNAGYNGSEQFAKGNRYGFFPAVSAGWVISNEKFLKNNKVLTLLKIRGSYGKVGNDKLISGSRFLYLDNINLSAPNTAYVNGLGYGQSVVTTSLKNADLQWEVAKKYNLGLEVELFNSFSVKLDLFKENRDNILRYRGTIPLLYGLPLIALPPVNIGVVENKGYELELNYKKAINKDWSILARTNLSFARNKQTFADEAEKPADYAYRFREQGFRIGQPFGYYVDRYFTSTADIAASPVQNVGAHASRPGDFKYKDLNGDGVIDERDQGPIGYSTVPEYQLGAAISVTYKNIDFSALVQGVTNVSNFYSGAGTFEGTNYYSQHLESWTQQRYDAGLPISYPRLTTQVSPNNIPNSFFIQDASFIRIKNVEIGYTIPVKWANKVGSKNIRLYANGLNLFTWDRLPTKNFDPELTGEYSYPITRVYNFGVNVTF